MYINESTDTNNAFSKIVNTLRKMGSINGSKNNIKREWDSIPKQGILPYETKTRMWNTIEKNTVFKKRRRQRWMAAASVLFLLSIGSYQVVFNPIFSKTRIVATKTFPQDIRILHLPDGTRVWVNENTEISYPKEFGSNERSVTLKGEAFFEVKRDPSKPFVIRSGEIKTTVLGTSFAIKAYDGMAPEVRVRTGKVRVDGRNNTVLLEKGDAGVMAPKTKTLQKQKTETLEPEWKKMMLDVDGLTLDQVIVQLQSFHHFDVQYANDNLKKLKLSGTLDARQGYVKMLQTVAFAVEVEIKATDSIHYSISK
ncbi:FecR family protein [Flavobacterium sp.]|uniref:FecR family protein n=1 Tax=Flavobacterium sp. TaxID=239 RepID=UPI003C573CA5